MPKGDFGKETNTTLENLVCLMRMYLVQLKWMETRGKMINFIIFILHKKECIKKSACFHRFSYVLIHRVLFWYVFHVSCVSAVLTTSDYTRQKLSVDRGCNSFKLHYIYTQKYDQGCCITIHIEPNTLPCSHTGV